MHPQISCPMPCKCLHVQSIYKNRRVCYNYVLKHPDKLLSPIAADVRLTVARSFSHLSNWAISLLDYQMTADLEKIFYRHA